MFGPTFVQAGCLYFSKESLPPRVNYRKKIYFKDFTSINGIELLVLVHLI